MKYPVVLVHWVDSSHRNGWQPRGSFKDMRDHDLQCQTAGFLVHDHSDRVVLALSMNRGQVAHLISIPRVAITKTTVLKKGKS